MTINTTALTRTFGDVTAVDSLDLSLQDGEIYGFLGPNGAGKSTTINMLLGFVPPTSGSGSVLGFDIEAESLEIRQATGILPENFGVYKRLTARKHVQFAIRVKDANDDPDDLLARVGLADAAGRKAGGFSTGMKQRLSLAMSLVDEPDLLILDEPSSGLDPNGAREMRTIIQDEAERGATIFFSSHIMEQVEAICDRVGIMRDGSLIAEGSLEEMKSQFDSESYLVLTVDQVTDVAVESVRALEGVSGVEVEQDKISASLQDAGKKAAVINAVEDAGVTVTDIRSREISLDDLFVAYTTGDLDNTKVELEESSP